MNKIRLLAIGDDIRHFSGMGKCTAHKLDYQRRYRAEHGKAVREYQRKYRAEHGQKIRAYTGLTRQEYMRAYDLRRHYNLTPAEFKVIYATQGGRCAVCRDEISGKNCCVDHSHTTGKVRGLLCSNCNRGIGFLRDDSVLLRAAITYLEKI